MGKDTLPDIPIGTLIKRNRFRVVQLLGKGAFGAVYKVEETRPSTNAPPQDEPRRQQYAMKTEGFRAQSHVLKMEVHVLKKLKQMKARHACKIICRGKEAEFAYIMMTLTGTSLSNLRKEQKSHRFKLHTALRVGLQCLEALQELHEAGYIHRDVKPGNYSIGRREDGTERTVYLLDFGLARKFCTDDMVLRTPRIEAGFRGTARYAPLTCHRRKEQSRKDDMESWLYQQIEMTAGAVPWRDEIDKDLILEWKIESRENGSLFNHMPREFKPILQYIDRLEFTDIPDYSFCYSLIQQVIAQHKFNPAAPYDWEIEPKPSHSRRKPQP